MKNIDDEKNSDPAANDWGSRKHVQTLLLMVGTVTGIYICYLLSAPFLPAFTWALALAVLFAPLFRWLEKKTKHSNLTATICVLAAALVVVVPATYVASQILNEASNGASTIQNLSKSGEWRRILDAHPRLAPAVEWITQEFDLSGIINNALTWLSGTAASFIQNSVMQLISIVLTFYMFFYFIRDRIVILNTLKKLSPLSEPDMNRIFKEVSNTIHATVYGTFVVSIVQGTLGGLMFWWLDLPSPMLWGVVMAILAIVPVLGAFIIWIPAAVFLLLIGSEGKALLLTVWGAVVIGWIDNLLYPMLVGNRLKLHTILAFVSIVGGLIVFGPTGLILGPIMFTVTRILLEIWSTQNKVSKAAEKAQ
jgi:predicted PurR-regulated permease PerM